MPAGSTYTPIATAQGTGSSSTISFTSIPSTYTDIVAVLTFQTTSGNYINFRVNNLSTSIYSFTQLYGTGSAAGSARVTGQTESLFEATPTSPNVSNAIIHFQNYSNTTTNKSYLLRSNDSTATVRAIAGMIQLTSAINRIDFNSGTFTSATQITLYGIASA